MDGRKFIEKWMGKKVLAPSNGERRAGWVTGFRTLTPQKYDKYDGQLYFVPGKAKLVFLVVFWPSENPVRINPVDVTLWWPGDPEPIPSCWGGTQRQRSRYIRKLQKLSQDFDRNADGRFCSTS